MKIMVISDVHLGSKDCNAKKLLQTLVSLDFKLLIIVGDLQEDQKPLLDGQWDLAKFLYEIRNKIIYIEGNHDQKGKWISSAIKVKTKRKFRLTIGGRNFCFAHGHQFDKIGHIFTEPMIDWLFTVAIKILMALNVKGYGLRMWLDSFHKNFSTRVDNHAIRYALRRHIDVIVCGHTHVPQHKIIKAKKGRVVEYVNCGGWIGSLCTYLVIDHDGQVNLVYVA